MEGFTIWFTGLPCSGKSTLAKLVFTHLINSGKKVAVFDGDEVRERLSKDLGYSKEDRDENVRRISYVCRLVTQFGGIAIAAVISPYRDIRDEARAEIGKFIEVYVECSLETCMERDVKGHYRSALLGDIQNFTGISAPYEKPINPEVIVHSDSESADESARQVIEVVKKLNYL